MKQVPLNIMNHFKFERKVCVDQIKLLTTNPIMKKPIKAYPLLCLINFPFENGERNLKRNKHIEFVIKITFLSEEKM